MRTRAKRPAAGKRKRGRPRDPFLPARRREAILAASAPILAERGYRGADVQRVADALGVGKGTLYRYFPTKRALFLGCVDNLLRGLLAEIRSGIEGVHDPLDRFARIFRSCLGYHDRHTEFVELQVQERAGFKDRRAPAVQRVRTMGMAPLRRQLRQLARQGRLRRIPVDRIADLVSALLYGILFTNRFSGRKRSFRSQARDVLDLILHGILRGERRKRRGRR